MDIVHFQKIQQFVNAADQDKPVPAKELLNLADILLENEVQNNVIHDFLELGHFSIINQVFSKSPYLDQWYNKLVQLITKSHYHIGVCFYQRQVKYPNKALFQIPRGKDIKIITYKESWKILCKIASSVHILTQAEPKPVIGIFSPNSLHGALVDLACLSFGFRVVPIPANVPLEHLQFILKHAGVTHLFIGGSQPPLLIEQYSRMSPIPITVRLPDTIEIKPPSIPWNEFFNYSNDFDPKDLSLEQDMSSIATIMYTSGTTANPKGIIFNHTNIISKRFARALALPRISRDDTLLSYLPLFHTFGRYLELTGSIFLGATYTFAESPSFKSLLKDFQCVKPSVFISIPKRWKQLYDQVMETIPDENPNDDELNKAIHKLTGGNLKWGLSAAGYLDPIIFRFFHKNNVQLLSGYGMTEATGGILMTPPNDYIQDSVGAPLPGISAKLGEKSELLIKGSYVSSGYYPESPDDAYIDGWFRTGDIFRERKGHYFIIDRIKEIYKNSRGQTISPQKIENMFREFESIKSVFLVGDGLEYNTVLLYPAWEQVPQEIKLDDKDIVREYFNTLVQSVNSFLAPYERVVSYEIIDQDFSLEKGEITPKNTFKRKVILSHFSDNIKQMYQKDFSSIIFEEYEIRIPNWLLREKGVMRSDFSWDGHVLGCKKTDDKFTISFHDSSVQIGEFDYNYTHPVVDINNLIRNPELWLGNEELVQFIGNPAFRHHRSDQASNLTLNESNIFKQSVTEFTLPISFSKDVRKNRHSIESLHYSALALYKSPRIEQSTAMNHLSHAMQNETGDLGRIAKQVLQRMRFHQSPRMRLKAIELLLPNLSGNEFITLFIESHKFAIEMNYSEELEIDTGLLSNLHFQSILSYLKYIRKNTFTFDKEDLSLITVFLTCVANYSTKHPVSYLDARTEINWWQMFCSQAIISIHATEMQKTLTLQFRNWLGQNILIAIDPESGKEYGWVDVIMFDSAINESQQQLLSQALSNTSILREAIFLFSRKKLIQLHDIPPKGIWISLLGERHGKSVFRVLVQTRIHKSYNFVINLNDTLDNSFIDEEIQWLTVMASNENGRKLVEDFGGYWDDHSLYTEEYIPGETLNQYLIRHKTEIALNQAKDRWQMRWLHFIWNGSMAYIDFWFRTGCTYSIANPSTDNLIIPEYDYTSGTRLISISDREPNDDIAHLLFGLYEQFILHTEKTIPGLNRMSDWEVLFTALIQVVTVKRGLKFLETLITKILTTNWRNKAQQYNLDQKRIRHFIEEVNEYGVLTKQVTFAALRYNRWLELNPEATKEARGTILLELYKDYHLRDLIDDYPETRIRFFLMTCFKNANTLLIHKLVKLQKGVRAKQLSLEDLDFQIQQLVETMDLSNDEEYFLTRLLFEHVQATDFGKLVTWDIGQQGHLDLISIVEDSHKDHYRIRPAFHPREIARFFTILSKANMATAFHQEHQFLLLITTNDNVIGGIFWKDAGNQTAYLERIVIKRDYQKRNLSTTLLNEFFQRLIHLNYQHVSVGFFQAGLFYKYGFVIEKQFGGLVKHLT